MGAMARSSTPTSSRATFLSTTRPGRSQSPSSTLAAWARRSSKKISRISSAPCSCLDGATAPSSRRRPLRHLTEGTTRFRDGGPLYSQHSLRSILFLHFSRLACRPEASPAHFAFFRRHACCVTTARGKFVLCVFTKGQKCYANAKHPKGFFNPTCCTETDLRSVKK